MSCGNATFSNSGCLFNDSQPSSRHCTYTNVDDVYFVRMKGTVYGMRNKNTYQIIGNLDPAEGVFAGKVKTQKVGNSISLPVPRTVKIRDGIQYNTIVFPDGTIVYKPKPQSQGDENPWLDGEYDHCDFREALDHGLNYSDEKRAGKEL